VGIVWTVWDSVGISWVSVGIVWDSVGIDCPHTDYPG